MPEGAAPVGSRGAAPLFPPAFPTLVSAAAFCLVATLNSGGYRYGVSDQAFYLPAVFRQLNPALFPRDAAMLATQDRLMLVDELVGVIARTSGIGVPSLFLAGYVAALLLVWSGALGLGGALLQSRWSAAALVAALTLRHRITETAVNTLEGYFHPRMVAFGLGLLAVVAFLRARGWLAGALVGVAAAIHPTIALWFGVWLAAAAIVARPPGLRVRWGGGLILLVAGGAVILGPLRDRMVVMDPAWTAVLASKDYVFPTAWPAGAWLTNLAYPLVTLAIFRARARAGVTVPREAAVVAGAVALAGVFLLSLPFVAMRLALAVQLQVSRVFWMLDVLTTVYVIWWIAEAPARRPFVRRAAFLVLAAAATARGVYVTYVEQDRAIVRPDLPGDDWTETMRWLGSRPEGAHVLADPGHAWKYGSSVRVAARRDVLLEEVKDSAMAMYGRDVARRVAERTNAIGDFQTLTPERALALAKEYELDFLVTEHPLALPIVYRNGRFTIHRLR
jgi:hypothetical protein